MATAKRKKTHCRQTWKSTASTHLHVSSHQWKGEEVVELNKRHRQIDNVSKTLGQKRSDEKAQRGRKKKKKKGPGMQTGREGEHGIDGKIK